MALRNQPSTRIDNPPFPTQCPLPLHRVTYPAILDQLPCLSLLSQSQAFKSTHLIRGKAIMQLYNRNIFWGNLCLLERRLCCEARHVGADELDCAGGFVEERRIGGECLAG